ncbi:group XIIB secretory phospholipase A2-like protein [Stigmatopora nigra]
MSRRALVVAFLFFLGVAVAQESPEASPPSPPSDDPEEEEKGRDDGDWGLDSLRGGFEAATGYFDSVLEFMGGRDGLCQYRCRYGPAPVPRPGYQTPEPDGCSSYFFGLPVPEGMDVGIPAMTKCCNQLDTCYDTCGSNKYRCDSKFRWCLHSICSDLKKSLGFVSKVEACETVADTLFNTVWTLGCRPYMNSQRAACFCRGEDRDEL